MIAGRRTFELAGRWQGDHDDDVPIYVLAPTPVVALNRPIAVGELDGPAAALALVDGLDLDGYHPFHAARADLLRRLNRNDEAVHAYAMAASFAPTAAERNFLAGQADLLSRPRPDPNRPTEADEHAAESCADR